MGDTHVKSRTQWVCVMALMTGWDAGRVSSTTALLAADGDSGLQEERMEGFPEVESETRQLSIDLSEARYRFEKFIRDFKDDNVFVYREQLRRNYTMRRYVLEVDLAHAMMFDEELANELKYFPLQLLPAFEDAAGQCSLLIHSWRGADADVSEETQREQLHPQVLLHSSQQSLLIRDLYSAHIGRLVVVPGIVIGTSKTNAKATQLHLVCRFCGDEQDVKANPGFQSTLLPSRCLNTGLTEDHPEEARDLAARVAANEVACGKPDAYRVVGDSCLYEDQQSLKLQEAPEDVPTGEMPRHLQLSAERYLVGKAAPGCRVLAVGVYSVNSVQDKQSRGQANGAVGIQTSYLQLVGLQVDEEGSGRIGHTFNREEEQACIELSRTPDIYGAISRSIAPAIYGHEDIKKAIACLLFGGSKKYLPDGMRIRGDINTLLLGDPGTAKSQFLKFAEKVAPIGVYTSGKGSSAAGLTASVIRDSHSREFYLEGGAMVLADGGVVCIDEFDKMHTQDRVAIHEAMEQQTISIAKAGITTILNARTSVLAAANPIFGSYDDMRSPTENIEFQSTILSRFDMIFLVRDHRNEARDRTIAEHVMNVHMDTAQDVREGELDISVLKKYISYCRLKCSPILTKGASEALMNHYVSIRSSVRNNNNRVRANGGGSSSAIPITVRQLEAIIRISESIAKMSLSPYATEEHVAEAIRLFKVSTLEAALSGAVTSESLSPEVMKEVSAAEALLKRRLPIGSRTSYQKLLKECEFKHKMDRFAIQKAVSIMAQRNEVQFRNQRKMIVRTR